MITPYSRIKMACSYHWIIRFVLCQCFRFVLCHQFRFKPCQFNGIRQNGLSVRFVPPISVQTVSRFRFKLCHGSGANCATICSKQSHRSGAKCATISEQTIPALTTSTLPSLRKFDLYSTSAVLPKCLQFGSFLC